MRSHDPEDWGRLRVVGEKFNEYEKVRNTVLDEVIREITHRHDAQYICNVIQRMKR